MPLRISTAARNAAVDAVVDLIDLGAGAQVLEIYSGTAPANLGDAPGGILLASFTLSDPAFGAAAGGTATALGVPIATTGLAAGNAGYARVVAGDGTVTFDTDDVGVSGQIVNMSTVTVSAGLDLELSSMTVTQPAGSP